MPTPLLGLLVACFGSDPVATDVVADPLAMPEIQCPELTTLETSNSSKGIEKWCDRGGVMHGPVVRYYPDDQIASKGSYFENVPDSDWIWWHPNGQQSHKGKYVKGKQTGSWTWWHENGNRAEEGDFLQGRKAGQWTNWYESGVKSEVGLYHNGMKNGLWTYFNDDPEGTVWRTELYQNGEMKEEILVDKTKPKAPAPK